MTQDVRTFPLEAYPEGEELDRLRAEFVQYQYRFHQFSDFYAIVARFAWEKSLEAVARDRDASLAEDPKGLSREAVAARARRASPTLLHPPFPSEQP